MIRRTLSRALALALLCHFCLLPLSTPVAAQDLVYNPLPPPRPLTFIPSPTSSTQQSVLIASNAALLLQNASLQATIQTDMVQATADQSTILAGQNSLAASQSALTQAQATVTSVQQALTANAAALQQVQTAKAADDAQIVSLQQQNQTLISTAGQVQIQVAGLQASVASLTAQQVVLTAAQTQLQSQLTTAQASALAAQTQVTSLTANVATLTTSLQAANAALAAAGQMTNPFGLTRMVWAHVIPGGSFPFQPASTGLITSFGAHYPQDLLAPGISTTSALETARFASLKAHGIDGVSIDRFADPSYFAQHIANADAAGISIAPCLDLSLTPIANYVSATVNYFAGYVAAATNGTHSSPMKVGAAWVVFDYQHRSLTSAQWQSVRSALSSQGITIFLVGDVSASTGSYPTGPAFASYIAQQTPSLDMIYWFGDFRTTYDQARYLAGCVASGKPFAGALSPGYARPGQLFVDAQGDAHLESDCQQSLAASQAQPGACLWWHDATADDFTEKTDELSSSDEGETRLTLLSWYAAEFHRLPPPFPDARIVVHVPQAIYRGQSAAAYVRVYNPGPRTALARAETYDPYGTGLSLLATPVLPGATVSVSVPIALVSSDSGNDYLTVAGLAKTARIDSHGFGHVNIYCTLTDDVTGQQLAAAGSPNVALFGTTYPGPTLRTLYYASASNKTIAGPAAYVHKAANGSYYVYMTAAPGTTARYLELLHDTRQVLLGYSGLVNNVPFGPATSPMDDRQDPTDHGYYLAREIDTAGNISYTGPLQVQSP